MPLPARPMAVEELARAKVNLTLAVLARRADGYHDLSSLMVPVELADRVRVAWRPLAGQPGVSIQLEVRSGEHAALGTAPPGRENLAWRAAERYLARETGPVGGRLEIELEKHIPVAAGLAGGSSDAAAVIRALDRMAGHRYGESDPRHQAGEGSGDRWLDPALLALAAGLGSDVPFCLQDRPAFVTGRGERIGRVPAAPLHLVLVKPALALATADVFAAWDAAPAHECQPDSAETLAGLAAGRAEQLRLCNDLLPAAARTAPPDVLSSILSAIQSAGALQVSLSGSGPTCFGLFATDEAAARAAARIRRRLGGEVWVSATRSVAG